MLQCNIKFFHLYWCWHVLWLLFFSYRSEFVGPQPMLHKLHGSEMGQSKKIYSLVRQWTQRDTTKWLEFVAWRRTWKLWSLETRLRLESEGSTWVVARSNAYNLLELFIRTVISIFLTIYLVPLMLRLVQKYLRLKQNLINFWNMWCSLCLFIVKLHVAPAALSICWWPSSWGLFFLVLQLAVKCSFN